MTYDYSGLKPGQYPPDAKRLAARDYSFIVTRGENCVEITFPDLPGCETYGETIEEALECVEDAKLAWVSTLLKHGEPVPPPRKEADFSGRFLVRGTPELHHKLAQLAVRSNVSLNQYVIQILSERVGLAWRNQPVPKKTTGSIRDLADGWHHQSRVDTPPKKNGAQTGTDKTGLAA